MPRIALAHARWIGSLLRQVSDQQLRDAFDAAGYSEGVRDSYVAALRERINQLTQLPARTQRSQRSQSTPRKAARLSSRTVKQVGTNVFNAFSKVGSTIKGN